MYRFLQFVFGFLVMLALAFGIHTYAYAEEPVEEPAPETVPSEPASVPVTFDNDALAAAIADALNGSEEEGSEEAASPAPAADYSAQLAGIQKTLDQIAVNTTPATPETAQAAFDVPFEEYTPTETMACIALAAVLVFLLFKAFWRF